MGLGGDNRSQCLRHLGSENHQEPLIEIDEASAHRIENDRRAGLAEGIDGIVRIVSCPVQTLFFIVERDEDHRHCEVGLGQIARQLQHDRHSGGVVACTGITASLTVVVRSDHDVLRHIAETGDDVSTPFIQFLKLRLEPHRGEPGKNIVRGFERSRRARAASRERGVGQSFDGGLQPVDRHRDGRRRRRAGQRQNDENQGNHGEGAAKYLTGTWAHGELDAHIVQKEKKMPMLDSRTLRVWSSTPRIE